ncbi:MAG: hypothetical protein ACUVRS_00090 [Armatimonadota bacterium]
MITSNNLCTHHTIARIILILQVALVTIALGIILPPLACANLSTESTSNAPNIANSDPTPSDQPTHTFPSHTTTQTKPDGLLLPDFAEIRADLLKTTFDEKGKPLLTVGKDKVTLRYQDITATASNVTIDWKTNVARFEGAVIFRIHSQEVQSGHLTVNLKTREWESEDLKTTITPELAKGLLREPLLLHGRTLHGVGTQRLNLHGANATTCNLPTPHYELTSRSLTVYENDRVILGDVTLYALGRRIFTLPRITIPLREIQRNPNLIPQVGQNQEEGLFLKTSYSYLATQFTNGSLLLDLMSRKGIGKGLQHSWRSGSSFGSLFVYHIFDRTIRQNTLTGRFSHSQEVGSFNLNLASDFRTNSYMYAPQSSSLMNQLSMNRERAGELISLNVNQSINNAFARTSRLVTTFSYKKELSTNSSVDTSVDYTAYTYDRTRVRLTANTALERRDRKFDWKFSAQRMIDLSDEAFIGEGVFGGVEKLQELAIVTDSSRLGWNTPLSLRMTYGNYSELPSPLGLGRAYIEAGTPVLRHTLSSTWTLESTLNFRQYVYTDKTAQYSLNASANFSKSLGPSSSINLIYRRQQARGFTPFRFDYVARYNVANLSINYQDSKSFRFNILTGYNFDQPNNPWQDITLRFAVQPSPSLLLYTATSYDLNRSQWRTLVNQIRIRAGNIQPEDTSEPSHPFRLDIGTRYDTQLHRLAVARAVLDSRIGNLWRIQANVGYNGFTRSFDYRSLMITRDLHCWEASLAYVNQGGFYRSKGITFTLRIKAFPFYQDFGTGPFGQALDTSVGEVY